MKAGAAQLLKELALLMRRHSPEDFEELAQVLRRPNFASDLSHVLTTVAAAVKQAPLTRRPLSTGDILESTRLRDPELHALLKRAQETLADRSVYSSLSSLVQGIESAGVHLKKRSYRRRDEVVREFIECASQLSHEKLQHAIDKIGTPNQSSDLRSWSQIIVPKKEAPGSG